MTIILGPVHTYADIFENGGFFLRFGVASTRKRRFRHAKTKVFENAPQSGGFRKRCFRVYVWTGENEGFRKRWRYNRVQSIATRVLYMFSWFQGLISSLIACIQLQVTMLNVHREYIENKYYEDAFLSQRPNEWFRFAFCLEFSCSCRWPGHFNSNRLTYVDKKRSANTKQIRDTFYQIAPNLHTCSCYVCTYTVYNWSLR